MIINVVVSISKPRDERQKRFSCVDFPLTIIRLHKVRFESRMIKKMLEK